MWRVSYQDEDVSVEVPERKASILRISLNNKVPHIWECGGKANCTTCRVRILDGLANISARTAKESQIAQEKHWDNFTRLACQTVVKGDIVIKRLVRDGGDVTRMQAEEIGEARGREVRLAVLFCDIRNFTPIAEQHLSYDVVHILNRFYGRIGERILFNNGYIYQYVGDEVVAWFGVNGGTPESNCMNAVRAGLGMLDSLSEINKAFKKEFGITLEISIGIHFGPAIIGRIGHPSKRQLSAVGDTINVASRIETMNRQLGTTFLVSEDVEKNLPAKLTAAKRAKVRLRGRKGKFPLLEVKRFAKPDQLLVVQNTFEQILDHPDQFGDAFYDRVFTLIPAARGLFRGDLRSQASMFVGMLQTVLQGLSRFDEIAPGLREMGRRHVKYGAQPEHYPIITRAFCDVLGKLLRSRYNSRVEEAWLAVMDKITQTMLEGAEASQRGKRKQPIKH